MAKCLGACVGKNVGAHKLQHLTFFIAISINDFLVYSGLVGGVKQIIVLCRKILTKLERRCARRLSA